ncbi:monoglyceride lipase-like isoform X2 [Ostrea edulis]|uniref:monoglyceride lipase-like isoform X2 n=1 Tax=Ostrea edulis TaxID=37623 RepID=UPI0024AFA73D|nr:monoglyceride lipase-like isoform X2 [Ostrea edulis]
MPTVQSETKFIKSEDDKKIFCKHWFSEEKPRALIFLCHGLGEHCLWYDDLAEALVHIGFYVFSHDHVGHGQSDGIHNHVDDFDEYTSVIFQHCNEVKNKYPDLRLFIFGHSMGGAITLLAATSQPDFFKGVITSGPAIVAISSMLPIKVFVGKILARIMPLYKIENIQSCQISHDQEQVKRYEEDPMVHPFIRVKWGAAWLECVKKLEERMDSIEFPLLALHGDADTLCDVKGSQILYDKAKSEDKEIKIYKGLYHSLLLELEEDRKKVLNDILEWLKKRM